MPTSLKLAMLRLFGHQHYILHGRDRVIRAFLPPDTAPSVPFEVPFFGMRYPGNLNSYIDWCVFMYGAYSRHELYLLRDVAAAFMKSDSNQPNFYDIGANVGQHSLFMSRYATRVLCFEPFAAVRQKLQEKIVRNQCTNVTVFPVGLGDVNRELEFFEPAGENQGTGSFVPGADTAGIAAAKLPVRRGDEFFAANGLPRMDVVKMDVEGFEMRVISGLRQRLLQDRPAILMEVSPATRAEMITEAAFRKQLYDDAVIYEIGCVSISSSYRLKPFRFASSTEILVLPSEKATLLPFAPKS